MNSPLPLAKPLGRPLGSTWTGRGSYQPGKTLWWHDAIIDEMLANPQLTKKEIAFKLNCSPSFVYMITCSDVWLARWEQRRTEHSAAIGLGLVEKTTRVAHRTLDRILDTLDDPGKNIPLNQLESLADKTLGRLGYGPKTSAQTSVTVNNASAVQVIVPATREELDAARSLIAQNEQRLAGSQIPASVEGLEAQAGVVVGDADDARPLIEGEVVNGASSSDGPGSP